MTQTPPYQVTDPANRRGDTDFFPFAADAEVAEALGRRDRGVHGMRGCARSPSGVAVVKRNRRAFTERATGPGRADPPRRWQAARAGGRRGRVSAPTSSTTTPTTAAGSSPTSRCRP